MSEQQCSFKFPLRKSPKDGHLAHPGCDFQKEPELGQRRYGQTVLAGVNSSPVRESGKKHRSAITLDTEAHDSFATKVNKLSSRVSDNCLCRGLGRGNRTLNGKSSGRGVD